MGCEYVNPIIKKFVVNDVAAFRKLLKEIDSTAHISHKNTKDSLAYGELLLQKFKFTEEVNE